MKRKYFLQLIILFFSLLLPACGFAAEKISSAEAENWANYKGEEILNILADKNLAQKYEKLAKYHNLLKLLVFILITIKADNQWCYLLCIFILALHWNFITENIFEIIERLLFAYFQDCKIAKILGCVAILNFSKCIIVKNKIIFAFSKTAKIKINFKTANF